MLGDLSVAMDRFRRARTSTSRRPDRLPRVLDRGVHDYVLHTGDIGYARRYHTALIHLLDGWYRSIARADGLIVNTQGPMDYGYIRRTGEVVAYYNGAYARALRLGAILARWVGDVAHADPGRCERTRWRPTISASVLGPVRRRLSGLRGVDAPRVLGIRMPSRSWPALRPGRKRYRLSASWIATTGATTATRWSRTRRLITRSGGPREGARLSLHVLLRGVGALRSRARRVSGRADSA